jgi:hypothetical protein
MSRESSTPFWKPSKWVITLKDVTRLASQGLASCSSTLMTGGTRQDEEQADHDRDDEADDLAARQRGGDATDGQVGAGHQPAPDVGGEDDAVVGWPR